MFKFLDVLAVSIVCLILISAVGGMVFSIFREGTIIGNVIGSSIVLFVLSGSWLTYRNSLKN